MKVKDLANALMGTVYSQGNQNAEVLNGIVGDLLSHVMGTAPESAAWVTIQTHVNVAAVAVLKEMPMIILACGREPSPDLVDRCGKEGICLVSTPLSAFGACSLLGSLGLKG
ncbi:serine kinase of the HPr protein, regulates carbohydrate metabolism [Thermanaerovibrio velox DSM 12556]|uniref:Serine kinase of the HPr protein, regulates carbohydrate metabolism n=1 Tax=Thermanaerovibrio velox DSM 12556 TaxID=926567 RepID=H0USD9_9BACT|nr:hypothetical protein [Thermanaerovibrio velox]EHM10228.1 serine kinase of the HPr protein, regulates carbohydrate metabolism [Thermanaerovibrio velox DSM 12556]